MVTIGMEEFHVREMGQSKRREIAEEEGTPQKNDMVNCNTNGVTEHQKTMICIRRCEEIK